MEPAGNCDHSRIVGSELELRQECRPSPLASLLFDSGAQTAVRRHSSTNRNLLDASMFRCLYELIHQDIDQGLLEAGAYISLVLLHELRILRHLVTHEVQERCLDTAEAIVEARYMRLRELVFIWVSLLSQPVYDRTSRIAQPHHLRALVECLTDCVIDGLSEDFILERTVYTYNLRVSS